ncbi:hypothetical protein ARNL5_02008 [Anaerolineae bacterium]|nr:hypothetical protein ARNL5_02008 [Anaerolineae bacterium]
MRRAIAIALVVLAGCTDLSAWSNAPGEIYRGTVVGAEEPSAVRRGFAAGTTLDMRFDARNASSTDPFPGALTTSDGALTDVALEPIAPLTHDVLSDLELPGGRVRNYVFVTRPTAGPLAGREPMVFVSLLGDGALEVRVIAGSGASAGDYYGIFRLTRQAI